ncbi:MAG TPA: alpha-1,2-fucosyltransferase [Trichococcus sp.]|nr:alpha-1,2-fucosyltransferase [Trichococcus sp.]
MVIVKIMGGIASQLHKYAVGRAVSLKYSMPLFLDLSWFESTPECDTPRVFRLNEFSTHYEIASKEQIERLTGSKAVIRVKDALLNRFGINLHKKSYIARAPWNLPGREDLKNGIYLAGEWGGDKYFSDIKNILVNEFKPAEALSETAKQYLQEITQSQSVSVHIRRGDYVSNINAAKLHALCDKGYYVAASELMVARIKSEKYFLFSDDKQEALKMVEGLDVTLIDGISDVEEFYLMSQCKHNICANSGFSYLAAWIGTEKDKVVISPKKWVKDPVRNSQIFESFYCDGWIYLDN